MIVVETYCNTKIYYSSFFERYIVLVPTKNGLSAMNRFETLELARKCIDENTLSRWWEKED